MAIITAPVGPVSSLLQPEASPAKMIIESIEIRIQEQRFLNSMRIYLMAILISCEIQFVDKTADAQPGTLPPHNLVSI